MKELGNKVRTFATANGICNICFCNPVFEHYKKCKQCHERSNKYMRARRALPGRCSRCATEFKGSSSKYCAKCKISNKQARQNRYERLKSEGICTQCGVKKARSNKVFCEPCTDARKQVYQLKKYA